jgi:hypothetical protein
LEALTKVGSDYGGWTVCLDLIPEGATVISAGIGNDFSFDRALMLTKKCFVAMVDPTLLAYSTVMSEPLPPELFVLHREAVCGASGTANIGAERSNGASVFSQGRTIVVAAISLDDLLARYPNAALLKLDIEGSEFEAVESWSFVVRPKQVAIGFHPAMAERMVAPAIARMEEHGYLVAHRVTEDVEDMVLFIREGA